MVDLPLDRVDNLTGSLVASDQHLDCLHETFVMEVHVVLNGLHLFYDIFGQEL